MLAADIGFRLADPLERASHTAPTLARIRLAPGVVPSHKAPLRRDASSAYSRLAELQRRRQEEAQCGDSHMGARENRLLTEAHVFSARTDGFGASIC